MLRRYQIKIKVPKEKRLMEWLRFTKDMYSTFWNEIDFFNELITKYFVERRASSKSAF